LRLLHPLAVENRSPHQRPSSPDPSPPTTTPTTMTWLTNLTGFIAPFFIIMSPIISYGDQMISMQRNKSSAGFSLDIPLIMLVASLLRYALAYLLVRPDNPDAALRIPPPGLRESRANVLCLL
jgi:hypothetical protein